MLALSGHSKASECGLCQAVSIAVTLYNMDSLQAFIHAVLQEQKDVLLTADIGGTNCRFSLWQANIKADVVYDEIFTKVYSYWRCPNAA